MRVYVITNLKNGKMYVGMTGRTIKERWKNHRDAALRECNTAAIHRALRKHGAKNFSIESVLECASWEEVSEAEQYVIFMLNTKSPRGYNISNGGGGAPGLKHSEETRRKIGIASKGHPVSEDARRRIGASHKGKPLSEEHRLKLSSAKLGKKMKERTALHRARIREGLHRARLRKQNNDLLQ